MTSKITIEISPSSARLEYDRGIELEFTADHGDILDHFDAAEVVAHFDSNNQVDDLLEAIGKDAVSDWLEENS